MGYPAPCISVGLTLCVCKVGCQLPNGVDIRYHILSIKQNPLTFLCLFFFVPYIRGMYVYKGLCYNDATDPFRR